MHSMDDTEIIEDITDDIFTNDDSLLNDTQDILSKGWILKSENLHDDIKKFTQHVQPTKRNEKVKALDEESFRYDIYSRNQGGFCTSTPISWALALESYISKTGTTICRWVHKQDKSCSSITSSELSLYFNTTNLVKIVIHYMQGYVMVKGSLYRKWIDEEFPKVRLEIETSVSSTDDCTDNLCAPIAKQQLHTISTGESINTTARSEDHMVNVQTLKSGLVDEHADIIATSACVTSTNMTSPNIVASYPGEEELSVSEPIVKNVGTTTQVVEHMLNVEDPSSETVDEHGDIPAGGTCNTLAKMTLPNIIVTSYDVASTDNTVPIEKHSIHCTLYNEEVSKEPISLITDDIQISVPKSKMMNESEIDLLWKRLEETSTAIKTQDTVIQKMISKNQGIELKISNLCPETLTLKAEEAFDARLTSCIQLLSEDTEKKIRELSKYVSTKIDDIYNKIDILRTSVGNQLKNFNVDHIPSETKFNDDIKRIEAEVKEMEKI